MLRKIGWIGLSFTLAGLFLLGIHFGVASADPNRDENVNASPNLSCNVPGSHSTIQSAISDAACDEVIIAAGSYSESLVITRSVTIRGVGTSLDASTTRINNHSGSRVFEIPSVGGFGPDIVVRISDLNIEEGHTTGGGLDAYGGGIYNAETLILNNVYMINNIASTGGAIATGSYAVTTIMNSFLAVNSAVGPGAYIGDNIYNGAALGTLTISNTELTAGLFSTGITTFGPAFIYDSNINGHAKGGVYATGSLTMDHTNVSSNGEFGVAVVGLGATTITATISNSTVQDNSDPSFVGDGGEGIAAVANVHLTVDSTTVQRNAKEGIAGQTQLGYFPVMTITNSIVQNNYDGGIEADGDLTILDTLVSGNTRTHYGLGGVRIGNADLRIERSEITNNEGGACGAGVLIDGAYARIRDTTISFNESNHGSGLCIYDNGEVIIRRSSIYSNTTTGDGGGIYVGYLGMTGTLNIANSTIAHNNADGNGGGIYALVGEVNLTNVTIARNYADADNASGGDGGGIMVDTLQSIRVDMTNTLIAVNKYGNNTASDCYGTVISGGNNLVRIQTDCTGLIGSDLSGNANLDTLQDKGGYTWVIPIGVTSPAADAGNHAVCTSQPVNDVDQRAYSRTDADGNEDGGGDGNDCDIGAYERNSEPVYLIFIPLILK